MQLHGEFEGVAQKKVHNWVVVSNIFYFHPYLGYLGKISKLTNIFQLG